MKASSEPLGDDDGSRLNALESPTAATRQHRLGEGFRTISRGSGSSSSVSGMENRPSRNDRGSYLQPRITVPNMTPRGAIVARDEEDEEILQQLSSSTAVSLPSKPREGINQQESDCQLCSVPGNIEIKESLSSAMDGAISSLINSFSTSTNTNLDHHEHRYSQQQNHSKQNLDLRNNDNSFHVLASLLVDFLKSKIVYDDAGAVVVLCHDDFVAIHRLLPESARNDFIEAVRFRLELTPVIPVSPLQYLTLLCQELGMDLDSTTENPILATTAAMQNDTPITTILTIPIQGQNDGQRDPYLFQKQSTQQLASDDDDDYKDDSAYERARRRVQERNRKIQRKGHGIEDDEQGGALEQEGDDESFVVASLKNNSSSSSSDSSSVVHITSSQDVDDQIKADGLYGEYYGVDNGKKSKHDRDGRNFQESDARDSDHEDTLCKQKYLTSTVLTEQETEEEESSIQHPISAEEGEESPIRIKSRLSEERAAAASDSPVKAEENDIIDVLKARIAMEQKAQGRESDVSYHGTNSKEADTMVFSPQRKETCGHDMRHKSTASQSQARTNDTLINADMSMIAASHNYEPSGSESRLYRPAAPDQKPLVCESGSSSREFGAFQKSLDLQKQNPLNDYPLTTPDTAPSYEEALKAVAMSISMKEKSASSMIDEQIMSFDFKKFQHLTGPEKIAVQQMLAELRQGLNMMQQSETSETIEFWRNHVVNLQSRLQTIYDEKMSLRYGIEAAAGATSTQSSRSLRKPDPRATSPSSQPSFCMTVENHPTLTKTSRPSNKDVKGATKTANIRDERKSTLDVSDFQNNKNTNSVVTENNQLKANAKVSSLGGKVPYVHSLPVPNDPCMVLPRCSSQLENVSVPTIELMQYIALTDRNEIMPPNTNPEKELFEDKKQSRQDYVDYCNEVPLVDVVAPADLPGGYHFEAEIEGKRFLATVPPGGVQQGETFTCYMRELNAAAIDIPIGRWKDGLCNMCTHGFCHAALWNAFFCPLIALGQIQTRIDLDFLGRPRFGTDMLSNRFMMWTVMIFWAFMNVGIFVACNVKWSRGMELSLADACAFALINVAMLGFVVFVTQSTRSSLREKFVISEERCFDLEDICCATLCLPCTISQMSRHTANYEDYEAICCSETGLPDGVRVEKGFGKEPNSYVV